MKDNQKFPNQSETVSLPTPTIYVKEKMAWEYRQIIRNLAVEKALTEEELNHLGADGWELAAVFGDPPLAFFYFKRPTD